MTTHTGVLRFWNFEKGYGFVYERVQQSGGNVLLKPYFAHVTKILSGEPILNCMAHFNVALGKKGEQAVDIAFEPLESPVKEISQ